MSNRKTVLVTMNIGDHRAFTLSHSFFHFYCEKFGLDFVQITERRIRHRVKLFKSRYDIQLEKYQLYDILGKYHRVVYVDGDAFINPSCPDLLALVAEDELGCVLEDEGAAVKSRLEEIGRVQKRLGPLPNWQSGYFNTGVLIVSKAHRELFRFDKRQLAGGRWPEQTSLNYHARRLSIPIKNMGPRCNMTPVFKSAWIDPEKRRDAHIIHYAGVDTKKLMDDDYDEIRVQWEAARRTHC